MQWIQPLTLMKLRRKYAETIHTGLKFPNHPYGILTVGGSGSGKTNALLNLLNH